MWWYEIQLRVTECRRLLWVELLYIDDEYKVPLHEDVLDWDPSIEE